MIPVLGNGSCQLLLFEAATWVARSMLSTLVVEAATLVTMDAVNFFVVEAAFWFPEETHPLQSEVLYDSP